MRRTARYLSLLFAAALLAIPQTHPKPAAKPKLILMVVVDQFRYDYLTRFREEYTGGLLKLVKDGAVFTNAHYEHFPTVTAVGHSTVLSGATPALSGIVGNEWVDQATGKEVTSVSDPSVKTLGAPGRTGASPHRLLVSTLSDEMKMAGQTACKAIGISMKDRSAILPVGHMADAAYWFDNPTGNVVSSTYYMNDLPGWVNDFNHSRVADKFLGAEWAPLSKAPSRWPATLFRKLPDQPGKDYYEAVYLSPFGNDILVELATRAIDAEHLGQNGGTDVLSLSFSSNDRVGHKVGPDSPEMRDMAIRTDRVLGKLFQHIDAKIGLNNVIIVLTADHGIAPSPNIMAEEKMPGGRIPEAAVAETVTAALTAKYGAGKWVLGTSGPAPFLNRPLIAGKGLDLAEVQKVAAAAVQAMPHIARVFTREDLKEGRVPDDYITRRIRNGFYYQRLSDLLVIPEPYWMFEDTDIGHGTPYNYDTHVPVIFLGAPIKPGRYNSRVAVNDIAPTLATILEVDAPGGSIGRVLNEILKVQ